jgi:hypothetical protein
MFKLHSTDDGRVPPYEYLAAGAITPKIGMALYMSSGVLAVAGGANAPRYISMTERSAALTSGDIIPVIRIDKDMIFESVADGVGTATVGALYDIATGGLKVDIDASTYDNFELVWAAATTTADGTVVRGRFVA